jgi:hypothetical protein
VTLAFSTVKYLRIFPLRSSGAGRGGWEEIEDENLKKCEKLMCLFAKVLHTSTHC